MTISEYIDRINTRYKAGISTEHSYRGELLTLVESLAPGISVTNEPKRVACGAPDYIITKRNIPIGYIEAKDLGADLYSKTYKEQFDRYKQSLDNLIITDYLTFQFYVNGSHTTTVKIGEITGNKIHPIPDNFDSFIDLIKNFCEYVGQTIKSAQKLSKMMAAKAKLLANVIELALDPEKEAEGVNELQNINLLSQYESFKQVLIHDITPKAFADIYAQTIAYGMFAARLNDPSLENFTRQEAAELIPKSNPFLRKLFQYIAGYDLDDRIVWIVDELADIFRATNVSDLLTDFGKSTQQRDPIIHFYETFLSEYDPKLRKSRGVWYTPEPVVNFIVRAVDDILKDEFGLSQGLADTSKIKVKVPGQGGKPVEKEVHRVQIFDPAAGTGTFLAEVIKQVYQKFEGQQGVWNQYVNDHLIPRLNGFEILMASYSMAHLKLDMLLNETGYKSTKDQRLRVYLTNSLEEHHPDTGTLFANWLSAEANEANQVKRDTPVMCIIGNPPYSGESSNKGAWIMSLMEDYKKEPGSNERLNERNPKWINDDYVKFLRYGQYFIERNGEGILAFINPHGFLDNPTFRGMRWNLLKTYDKIYLLDLHGNTKKRETSPDGSSDINVFDIMQGVSINIFIKTGKKKSTDLGKIFHFDLFGEREAKYNSLLKNCLDSFPFQLLPNIAPQYFFVNKNFDLKQRYDLGFSVSDLFPINSVGIVTANDSILINTGREELINKVALHYGLNVEQRSIVRYSYRPFDMRFIYYDLKLIERGRGKIMSHFLNHMNLGLMTCRQIAINNWDHVGITNTIVDDSCVSNRSKERGYIFPLYLYHDGSPQNDIDSVGSRSPNLNQEIVKNIAIKINLSFSTEKELTHSTFAPIDILDYIYAILHSPLYRKKYKEFLKIDFPRIPYPIDKDMFWWLVNLGGNLRQIHLLETPVVDRSITTYPVNGSNDVAKLMYDGSKVWINNDQYFDGVRRAVWEFYIGGYQPAQKWLKDRKGRLLTYEDIMHYQRIIVALTETDRIMKEIDKIDFLS